MLFLTFKAGHHQYALAAARILQILPCVALRPYAGAPDCVAGLLNFHGRPVAVIDFGRLINGRLGQRLMSTRIILAEYAGRGGQRVRFGLMAENATTMLKKDRPDARPAQPIELAEIIPAELEKTLLCPPTT